MNHRSLRLAFAPVALFCGLTSSALAQCELIELLANDGNTGDQFGVAVDVAGDVAIVGADRDDDGANNAGSAYVYRFDGTDWSQEAKLTASSPGSNYHFGQSVAIDGNLAAVGSPDDDDLATKAGSVYVYRYDGAVWAVEDKLTASDFAANHRFGWAVDVSGDVIVSTAKFDDDVALDSGAAYVYRRVGMSWIEEDKLKASDPANIAQFGDAVAIDGDTIVVGAWQDDDLGSFTGSAYVFENTTGWNETAKLVASDGSDFEWFGRSVDVEGDLVLVGAYEGSSAGGSSTGAAYVFRDTGSWMEEMKLTAMDAANSDRFGWSVALDGGVAVVGAYQNGSSGGSLYFFEESVGIWSETSKLGSSDGAGGDDFAKALSAGGGRLIAGAPEHVHGAVDTGSAYLFSSGAECVLGTVFCQVAANSVDSGGARISASGSTSELANDLVLQAGPMDTGQPGIFFYGTTQLGGGNGLPFGDGFRCVGGSVTRLLPPGFSDGSGVLTRAVDNTTNSIASGMTLHFQGWYRDPDAMGTSFNLTDGLTLIFGP